MTIINIPRDIDLLRTKYWYAETAMFLGDGIKPKSPYWFAKNFSRRLQKSRRDGVSDWRRYKLGKSVPKTINKYNAVEAVAEKYPFTDTIFKSRFWFVLKGDIFSQKDIEDAIASLGTRVVTSFDPEGKITRDRITYLDDPNKIIEPYGMIVKIILDDTFWQNGMDNDELLKARFRTLKEMADFDVLQATVLMLAWADNEGDTKLWNHLCGFYQYLIPDFILNEHILFKDEVLAAIDEYAKRRKHVNFRPRIESYHRWEEQKPRMQNYYFEHYFATLCFHDVFLKYKVHESMRWSWAKVVAEVVSKDEHLWRNGNQLWWPAGYLLYELILYKKIRVTSFMKIRDKLRLRRNKSDFFAFPLEPTDTLKLEITSSLNAYIQDPEQFEKKWLAM